MVSQMTVRGDSLLVGSSRHCEVYLQDMRVAERHLLITRTREGWLLRQLDASGILATINQSNLTGDHLLRTGDQIALADYVLTVYPDAAERPATDKAEPVGVRQKVGTFQLPADAVVKHQDEPLSVPGGRLEGLAQVCFQASRCGDIDDFMRRALTVLTQRLPSRVAWMGLAPDGQGAFAFSLGLSATGQTVNAPALCRQLYNRCIDRKQYLCLPACSHDAARSLLAGPLLSAGKPAGMIYLDRSSSQPRFDSADLDALRLLCTQLTPFAGMAASQQVNRHRPAETSELVTTHEMQDRLTPKIMPTWPELEIAAARSPGTARASDVYDVVQLPGSNLAAVVVASAAATGSEPALLMAEARAAFRVSAVHADSPHVLMHELNWLVYDGQTGHSVCCCAVLADPATGLVRYCTAGTPGACILDQGGRARGLVGVPKSPIGVEQTVAYDTRPEQLDVGETLVLFTGGADSLTNASGQNYGRQRLLDSLAGSCSQPVVSMLDELTTEIRVYRHGGKQPDDITVLLLRYTPNLVP